MYVYQWSQPRNVLLKRFLYKRLILFMEFQFTVFNRKCSCFKIEIEIDENVFMFQIFPFTGIKLNQFMLIARCKDYKECRVYYHTIEDYCLL